MTFIVLPAEKYNSEQIGGKAWALAVLQRAGLPVPPWFALTPAAFDASLSPEQRQALKAAEDEATLQAAVAEIVPGEAVRRELETALAALCPAGERVAVRSSAIEEDGAAQSFAGQYDSFLNVSPDAVAAQVAAVWRSGFSQRLLAYRRANGLQLAPRPPAVLIQRMVDADTAGIAFSADPVTGQRGIAVVAASAGLGAALASGERDADTYRVDRDGHIVQRELMASIEQAEARHSVLDDAQIGAIAALARQAERCFGRPQDIEWALEGGHLYLLQSRPITTLASLPDPDGLFQIWDNSNIIESYSGITTPLTFSFARRAYEEVYRQFCRLLCVPRAAIAAHDNTFRHMLGLIQGRVYYNLLNWYRLLALLPGFTVNRRFMEQMMGVREGLPEPILAEMTQATWQARLWDGLHLLGSVGSLIANHLLLPQRIHQFRQRLEAALAPPHPPLEAMRADELVAYYRDLERQLLTRWDAPLINDFLAMIFFGTLRRLTAKWCGDETGAVQNALLCGEGGMISAEPARRIRELADIAASDAELMALLCGGTPEALPPALEARPAFAAAYRAYLDQFGDRCLEELKLESPTLHDDPRPLMRAIGQAARRDPAPQREATFPAPETPRAAAERHAQQILAPHPLRRQLFQWTLRNARARVRDRENLRFERTRLFGRARRIFTELGRRLYALDALEALQDVFYLEVEEVLGFVEGTTTCTNLRGLTAVRRAAFARYREMSPPDDRFETRGVVALGSKSRQEAMAALANAEQRAGLGCCPGVVRGPVRVITDPRTAELPAGTILVAEHTDPGWILLFSGAAGLLVERGSLLSHSAIVAREMGIPAIVALPGVTRWLQDGDCVEMDGSSGLVRRLER